MKAIIILTDDDKFKEEELINLLSVIDIEVIDKVVQKLDKINSSTFINKGKLIELSNLVEVINCDLVVFNDELTPSMIKNIDKYLDCDIIDRSMLILNIFEKRANTPLSKLEVENAKLKYLLPRISLMRTDLSRQAGTSGSMGSKGPGEKLLELDRRKIERKIYLNNLKIKKIKTQRFNSRSLRKKSEFPVVSFVGYTNSGKSSTMNTIMNLLNNNKLVGSENILFKTIDTSSRVVKLDDNKNIILTDTVGFVDNLPNHLIESFKSTLEEIKDSSLLIHVCDISNPNYLNQIKVTNKVLEEIGCTNIPMIYLFNKADLITNYEISEFNGILFSNKENYNHEFLINEIKKYVSDNNIIESFKLNYNEMNLYNFLKNNSKVLNEKFLDDYINITCLISEKNSNYIKKNISNDINNK